MEQIEQNNSRELKSYDQYNWSSLFPLYRDYFKEKYPHVSDMNSSDDEFDDFLNDLDKKELYKAHEYLLKKLGTKEANYIACMEPGRLADGEHFFDYPTLFEFDEKWKEFQLSDLSRVEYLYRANEESIYDGIKESKNYIESLRNRNNIYMQGDWFRLIDEDDKMLYATFISAYYYLLDYAEDTLSSYIEELIPYDLVDDEDLLLESFNNPEINVYKANGREKELDYLTKLSYRFLSKKIPKIIRKLIDDERCKGKGFRVDEGYDGEKFDPITHFIFWDAESLKSVRTTNFLNDFNKIKSDNKCLEDIENKLNKYIRKEFGEIAQKVKVLFEEEKNNENN